MGASTDGIVDDSTEMVEEDSALAAVDGVERGVENRGVGRKLFDSKGGCIWGGPARKARAFGAPPIAPSSTGSPYPAAFSGAARVPLPERSI
ncbi:hypothetical protein TB2_030425 [Malus domestica]